MQIKRRKNAFYYTGSAYYSITRSLVQQIVDKKELLLKRYRYTLAPDEVFMQTAVIEMDLKDSIWKFEDENGGLRLIDWSHNTGSHPYVFTKQDYDVLIHQPEDVFWARKFDEIVDMEIVNMLYNYQSNK